ncbi:MAG: hypothetical protein AAFV33_23005 [Chloroflexota bacterium]
MAIQHPEPQEPYISYDEVIRWVEESRKIDRQRRYRSDDLLFRVVCYLFVAVLIGYVIMRVLGMM